MRHLAVLSLLLVAPATSVAAQQPIAVRVVVTADDRPLAGVVVRASTGAEAITDAQGVARLMLAPGPVALVATRDGYLEARVDVVVSGTREMELPITLVRAPVIEEEVVVLASTRTGRRVEDEPTRVEVLGREEIEEKMLMTPGDIVMMLNEMGGLRVQATSPSLGAAAVRIQGMRGRYTRLLSDGLPIHGEQPGGLGLLQIPPMDLGRVEVIKGMASALYGAGAMGGVVNLISRQPGDAAEQELLVNVSTRGAADGVFWWSAPLTERTGMSLLASGHRQGTVDVDGDGWADMASYARGVVRPRFYWNDEAGRSIFATAGVTREEREGGTIDGRGLPATGLPYREALETTRADAGLVAQTIVGGRYVATIRGAMTRQWHDHTFGEIRERDRHTSIFGEAAMRGSAGRHTWVAGAALDRVSYAPDDVPQFAYAFTTPGLFAQDDMDIRPWLTVSASGRLDWHSEYGFFASPRISALLRRGGWTSRISAGTGFHGSGPLTEETEAAGLTRLVVSAPLEAEQGRGWSIDLGHAGDRLAWTATLFSSHIDDAVVVDRDDEYRLRNLDGATRNTGFELLATWRQAPVAITGTYTFVRARETDAGAEQDVELTPKHSVGLVAMVESEERGRLGLEVYVTGRQRLDADPYRTTSEPYVIVGLLAERRFGRFSLFVNGENLTGVRQSEWGPVLRPSRAVDGRWTVDAWAPLEGRVINGGLRVWWH